MASPTIIFRYLLAEVTRTCLVIAAVFTFLTLGLGLSKFIARAAAGQIPVDTVIRLAFFATVKNFEIVLPVSVFLAILLALGRLCRDNEMAAFFAGGTGLWRIYRPFFVFAAVAVLVACAVSVFAKPYVERAIDRLLAENTVSMVQLLTPGRFRTFKDGRVTFYAARRDADGNLRDVFVRINKSNDSSSAKPAIITADRARQRTDRGTQRVVLVLDDGWRYDGRPGDANYRIVRFDEYGLEVRSAEPPVSTSFNTKSTRFLMASSDPDAIADWQTRLSVPISILILTLLALPLGQVPPRAGRYGRITAGVLLCVLYVNAINLASAGIKESAIPPWLGVWWVHVLALAGALAMLARQQGLLGVSRRGRS